MSITKDEKSKVISDFKINEKDTGSVEVQIAVITKRIENLKPHFEMHKADHHSKHGLIKMVNKRKKLLKYLAKKDHAKYVETCQRLGIRK
ncbi:MAG: 30S ribosomal protein S15 [Candidatus Muiribacteriaceae bacterium]